MVEQKRDHEQKCTLKEARFNGGLNLYFHFAGPLFFVVELIFEVEYEFC